MQHTPSTILSHYPILLEWLFIWGQWHTAERIYVQKGKYLSMFKTEFPFDSLQNTPALLVTTTEYNAKVLAIWFPSPNHDQHPMSRVLHKQSNIYS